ncbi:putative ABC-type ATPase [Sphaerotilus sulfidivorans]|uniref:ABC-type ATPase n=1 Tax=Sphaerotilus sulfidivorans TaxID=639200 RepID=A0A5C1Q0I8_9BURK|nr:hypothetical protein [Sphaerotilus sulfidivorans]NZD46278.1 hypothetical protein [Sphaerotilus sulfidivorans]QEN01513.1 hypothetical protein EWH46_12465 [Sphaerotilus sulfidivorans]
MSQPIPRLRVFAGPNGSGKSTIKDSLLPQWLGVYVNADDIEKAIRTQVISRYHRSLELLPAAVEQSSRAYVFDNSNHARTWIAEITDGDDMELQTDQMPHWFRTALWDPFAGTTDT